MSSPLDPRAMQVLADLNRRKRQAEDAQIAGYTENLASAFVARIARMVSEFQQKLREDEEIGIQLVQFGQTITIHVLAIGSSDPSLVRFIGRTTNGDPVELIQHVSQITLLLMAVKALDETQPIRRIGFIQE